MTISLKHRAISALNHGLAPFSAKLVRLDGHDWADTANFIPLESTLEQARAAGLSVGEFVEKGTGTSQATVHFMAGLGVFDRFVRVVRPGRWVVFDIMSEECLANEAVQTWVNSGIRNGSFPAVMPSTVARDYFEHRGFTLRGRTFIDVPALFGGRAVTADSRTEIRAVYGGLPLAMAGVLSVSPAGAAPIAMLSAGMAGGRILGIAIEGVPPSAATRAFLGVEVMLAGLLALAASRPERAGRPCGSGAHDEAMDDLVTVDSGELLRELIGDVGERARCKARPSLDADDRRWLQASSLCFVATSDGQGRCDASPKRRPPRARSCTSSTR